MSCSVDAAFFIDGILGGCDDSGIDGNDGVRLNDHAVEVEFHPTFADEVTGVLVLREMADEITAIWEGRAAIQLRVSKLTHHRIADLLRVRRNIGLRYGAGDHGTCRNKLVCACSRKRGSNEENGENLSGLQSEPPGENHRFR